LQRIFFKTPDGQRVSLRRPETPIEPGCAERAAILTFLNQTIPKKWEHFRDRINDNFRVISPADFRIIA
jgi:hypothetical protein